MVLNLTVIQGKKDVTFFMSLQPTIFLSLLLLLISCCSCFAATEIFQIRNRPADEILPVIRAALSPQGRAVADSVGNMIIVNDTPEVIETVRSLLLSSDQRMPQVTVQMTFESTDSDPAQRIRTTGKKPGRHLSSEDTLFRYADSSQSRKSRSFVTLFSGSSGYIRMAREIPVTEKWIFFCRHHGVPYLLKETRTIETGMEVSPVAAGDQVILTIIPRISWMVNGRPDSFRFVDAATRLTMPRSQWIGLGGMSSITKNDSDILEAILSTAESSKKDNFSIQIKADVTE